jgi:hypothetical protein
LLNFLPEICLIDCVFSCLGGSQVLLSKKNDECARCFGIRGADAQTFFHSMVVTGQG